MATVSEPKPPKPRYNKCQLAQLRSQELMAAPEDDEPVGMDDSSNKTERKKERERRRREEIARAFQDLQSILSSIDPESGTESNTSPHRRRRRRSSMGGDDDIDNTGMTRLDLIHRTIGVLQKLRRENSDLRNQVNESGRASGEKEVLVMVPTLSPVDSPSTPPPPIPAASQVATTAAAPSTIAQRATSYPSYQPYASQQTAAVAPAVGYSHHAAASLPSDTYQPVTTYYSSAVQPHPPQHASYHPYSSPTGGSGSGGWGRSSQAAPPPQHYPPSSHHHQYAYPPQSGSQRPRSDSDHPQSPQPDRRRDL